MNETWVEAPIGIAPHHLISNLGRVKNIKNGEISLGGNSKGYRIMRWTYYKATSIHRLVAKVFIPNPENKPYVNHINGIKSDNRVENLEWCTHIENINHAKAQPGYQSKLKNRYKEHETVEILKLNYVYGLTQTEIAKIYNRSMWSIRKVLTQTHHLHKAISL